MVDLVTAAGGGPGMLPVAETDVVAGGKKGGGGAPSLKAGVLNPEVRLCWSRIACCFC